jgi:hypothetical protein
MNLFLKMRELHATRVNFTPDRLQPQYEMASSLYGYEL